MPNNQVPVPAANTAVTPVTPADPDKIMDAMAELLQRSQTALALQDGSTAKEAAMTARALYEESRPKLSPDALFFIGLMKDMICLFQFLTSVLVLQVEGRFTDAIKGVEPAFKLINDVTSAMDRHRELNAEDQEALAEFEPILRPFPIMFRGMQAYIRADLVGYQGRVPEYLRLLRDAVTEFRRVNQLPQSTNPGFLALTGMCTALADRLETRATLFELRNVRQYIEPQGKKILIIHGHAEDKWRELRDLLQDRYQQEVVVLEEEVDAGSVLIEKFIRFASECCYAFAILTPDDFAKNGDTTVFQARPNVLFELGWFYGRFGPDHVAIVKKRGTAVASDLDGILTIDFTDKVSEGLIKIENELQHVGLLAAARPARKPRARSAAAPKGAK
jgi:hypothetical protein